MITAHAVWPSDMSNLQCSKCGAVGRTLPKNPRPIEPVVCVCEHRHYADDNTLRPYGEMPPCATSTRGGSIIGMRLFALFTFAVYLVTAMILIPAMVVTFPIWMLVYVFAGRWPIMRVIELTADWAIDASDKASARQSRPST